MFAFYAVRGYTPDILANLSEREKMFLYCAREMYLKEKAREYEALFGTGR